LSNSTASITIAVNSGTPLVVNNPNLAPGTKSAGTQATTVVNVDAPIGDDTFTVDDFDATGGTGNLLAANSIPFDVVIDTANTVPITLNGNLGKIACAPIAPFVSGTAPTFTLVGPAGQIALMPEDADGNIIVAPGVVPTLTLASATSGAATITSTSTANQYVVNPTTVGTATALTASGTNLAGTAVTSTCTITREEALYVVNHSIQGTNPAIDIYPASAATSATPIATIAGSRADVNQPQYIAVANTGQVYVSNQGPQPGATYGPTQGYIAIYAPAASGNVAPTGTISGLRQPTGLSFDPKGDLFSTTAYSIDEYAPPVKPGATRFDYLGYGLPYTVPDSGESECYANYVDANSEVYLACSNEIEYWAAGWTPTTAGTAVEFPEGADVSLVGVTASSTTGTPGSIYATLSDNNLNSIAEFQAGASGDTTVPTLIKSTGFSQPFGLWFDGTAFYVTNFGNGTVEIFSSATLFATGVASATLTLPVGPGTGAAAPYGVTTE